MHKINYFFLAALPGAASVIIQVVLMRAFLAVFYGNELCIGFILAIWLLWTGVGSRAASIILSKTAQIKNNYIPVLFAFILFFSGIACGAVKFIRLFFNISPGEYISFAQLIFFVFILLAVPCFLLGFFFSFLAVYFQSTKYITNHNTAAIVYGYEALGCAVAGIFSTFLLFPYLNNIRTLFLLGTIVFLILYIIFKQKSSVLIFTVLLILFLSPVSQISENYLNHIYWRSFDQEMHPVKVVGSRFGEVSIVSWDGEYVLYINGIKQSVLPDPVASQELAALIVSQSPSPERILLIGGGYGGLAHELARYKNSHIDFVELNKTAWDLSAKWSGLDNLINQENLAIHFVDGRSFLQKAKMYDMIIINQGNPATASTNRYYTQEFIEMAEQHLTANGVFVICNFPSSENYMGRELSSLNAGLYASCKTQFADVLVIPGDAAIFFASKNKDILTRSADILAGRFSERIGIRDYFFPQMFAQYYIPERIRQITQKLESCTNFRINSDQAPAAYYYDFALWNKLVKGNSSFMSFLEKIRFNHLVIFVILSVLLFYVYFRFILHNNQAVIILLAVYAGYTGMSLNIVLLLIFQSEFGYLYEGIGAATGLYMLGAGAASMYFFKYSVHYNRKSISFFLIIAIISLFLFTFLFNNLPFLKSMVFIYILFFAAGCISGGIFPVLNAQYDKRFNNNRTGSIYAAELVGGAVSALLLTGLLIPLFGFYSTFILSAIPGLIIFVLIFLNFS